MSSAWRAALFAAFSILFTSCGGNTANSNPTGQPGGSASHAFVSNYGTGTGQTLTGYAVASTNGNLLSFDLSVVKVPPGPTSITTDGSGKFLYVGSQGGLISGYSIDPVSGALTQSGSSPYGAGRQVNFITVDASGKYLFSVDNLSNTVWPFTITAGVLNAVASSGTVPSYGVTPAPPVTATVDPLLRNLYVAMGAAGTEIFHITSGALLDAGTVPPTSGAESQFVAIERTGPFAYAADGVSGVAVYLIDQTTGDLSLMIASPVASGSHPTRIALTPDSKYLYVANQGDGTISQFALSSGGGLASIGTNLVAGNQPVAMAVDPAGLYLYVVNQGSDSVAIFRISAVDGTLTAQAPTGTGPSPSGIVTVP
ncbi:MAG TPA: beta-propeller fold lactonase family protein [Terriglobales bacterium]